MVKVLPGFAVRLNLLVWGGFRHFKPQSSCESKGVLQILDVEKKEGKHFFCSVLPGPQRVSGTGPVTITKKKREDYAGGQRTIRLQRNVARGEISSVLKRSIRQGADMLGEDFL